MSMLTRFPTTATAGIQYVGGTTAAITGSTATTTNVSLTGLTGGLASAPVQNDLVIVYYGVGSTTTRSIGVTTSGYTEVAELTVADTYDANLSVSYKLMGATPDTQVTVSATGATADAGAVAVQVWRYVDSNLSTPLDVSVVTATAANSVLCNPPAITPVTAGAMIIAGGAGAHARGVATYSSSDLRNFITRGGPDSTNDVTVGMGSRAGQANTAFDPAAFTFSAADSAQYSWAAVTLALTPRLNGTGPATFIASAQTQNTTNTDLLVINKPTGTVENDLMVAVMASNGNKAATWTGDTGWTEVADQGGTTATVRIAYKVAGASEGASYTFTASTANNLLGGCILTYRGAVYDAIGSFVTGTAVGSLTPTGPSAALTYSTLIGVSAANAASVTYTVPFPMTTRVTDSGADAPSYVVADEIERAGATGTRTFTSSGTASQTSAIMLTIKAT